MEKSVGCLSGWSLCLLRLVIMSNKRGGNGYSVGSRESGRVGGWAQDSFLDLRAEFWKHCRSPLCYCVNWRRGCEDKGLCEESGGSPGNLESCWLRGRAPSHYLVTALWPSGQVMWSPAHQPAAAPPASYQNADAQAPRQTDRRTVSFQQGGWCTRLCVRSTGRKDP